MQPVKSEQNTQILRCLTILCARADLCRTARSVAFYFDCIILTQSIRFVKQISRFSLIIFKKTRDFFRKSFCFRPRL